MTDEEIEKVVERYNAGKASEEDKAFLESWYLRFNESHWEEVTHEDRTTDLDIAWSRIKKATGRSEMKLFWASVIRAAAVLMILSFGTYCYLEYARSSRQTRLSANLNKIVPGSNKAYLTLADGSKIVLTDAENGELAYQSGIKIVKTRDGQLIYTIAESANLSHVRSYNTIETPAGGQYQVNLPDGSRVWLNSSSSLRYPVRFIGNERSVEITGEVYFEIAHNKSAPFKVTSKDQTVEVLGTHFNIMAYVDEGTTNTTLLEGSVKVIKESDSKIIAPGQQTRVAGNSIDVVPADIHAVTAWKDGYFMFKNESIQNIMRQISRWYNVEVEYKANSSEVFGGRISRSRSISDVLNIMESTGLISFKIIEGDHNGKGRRVIVMP